MAANANQGKGKQPVQKQGTGKKRKVRKKSKIIIFAVEIVVIMVMLGALYMLRDFGKSSINRIDVEDNEVNIAPEVEKNDVMKGYRNIALFGVDSTGGALEKNTRSDTIIIASINQDTGEVKLVSVFRDTYLNLSNDKYSKANSAYMYGGAKQAMKMLNMNLDMDITDFVTIGFGGLKEIVDALGGISLDITKAEISHMNNYQITMSEDLKCDYTPVKEAGYQKVDGLQAVAYCRVRYTKGNDFKRAERQRTVIQAIVDEVKKADLSTLTKIANNVAGEVYTSLDMEEILSILAEVAKYSIVDEAGFPNETHRGTAVLGSTGDSVIPLDLEKNVTWLHQFLFDAQDYTPSATVKECSDTIRTHVAKYKPDMAYPED